MSCSRNFKAKRQKQLRKTEMHVWADNEHLLLKKEPESVQGKVSIIKTIKSYSVLFIHVSFTDDKVVESNCVQL